MNSSTFRQLAGSAAAVIAFALPLHAQDADNNPIQLTPFSIEATADEGYQSDQSVSGSRFVTQIKDLPFSLQVVPAQFLAEINSRTLEDSLQYATGALAYDFDENQDVNIYQRGFLTQLHLRDGVRSQDGSYDSWGSERLEVLSGPSSVLFGITNPGGTVNVVSKMPTSVPLAVMQETVGEWGTTLSRVDLGGQLGESGSLSYRLPVSCYSTNGYRINTRAQRFYADPSVKWQIDKNTSLLFNVEYLQNHDQPRTQAMEVTNLLPNYWWMEYYLPKNFNGNTDNMGISNQNVNLTATFIHSFNEHWVIRNVAANIHADDNGYYSVRGGVQAPLFLYPRQATDVVATERDFQNDTDVVGSFDERWGKLTVIGEVEFQDDFNATHAWGGLGVGAVNQPSWNLFDPSTWNYHEDDFSGMTMTSNNTTRFRSTAYSAVAQWKSPGGACDLSAGVRYDDTRTTFDNYFAGTLNVYPVKKTSTQLGALWHIAPTLGAYVNYSTSFNPVLTPLVNVNQQSYSPVPITGTGYEAGFKWSLFDGSVQQTIAVYRIQEKNIVETLLGVSSVSSNLNYEIQGGLQRSQGIEYTVNIALGRNYAIFGGISYDDARIMQDSIADVGQEVAFAYPWKANVWQRYTFSHGPLSGAYIGAGLVYVERAPAANGATNAITIPSYATANAEVGYGWKAGKTRWDAKINLSNVLNRLYINYLSKMAAPRNVEGTVTLHL